MSAAIKELLNEKLEAFRDCLEEIIESQESTDTCQQIYTSTLQKPLKSIIALSGDNPTVIVDALKSWLASLQFTNDRLRRRSVDDLVNITGSAYKADGEYSLVGHLLFLEALIDVLHGFSGKKVNQLSSIGLEYFFFYLKYQFLLNI